MSPGSTLVDNLKSLSICWHDKNPSALLLKYSRRSSVIIHSATSVLTVWVVRARGNTAEIVETLELAVAESAETLLELPGTGADIVSEFELAELPGTGADINEFELAVAESAETLLELPGTGADINEFELAELSGTGADINEFELAELSGTGADINEFELAVAESAGTLLALPGTGADIIDIVSEFELALAVADTETLLAVLQNSVIFLFLFNNSFN